MTIDTAALVHILQQSSKLTKLCLRNMDGVKSSSFEELIEIVTSIIMAGPKSLTELDLRGIGGSKEQGELILDALIQTPIQLTSLDISENQTWAESQYYSDMLCEVLMKQNELEIINLSYIFAQKQNNESLRPILHSLIESPLINTLKSVSVLGVVWTIEEVRSMIFPLIRATKVLEKFNF